MRSSTSGTVENCCACSSTASSRPATRTRTSASSGRCSSPLSQLLIYFIVIGQFLGAARGIPSFAIFVFTGLTAWGFFLEAVTGGTGSIVANSGLVKKVYLPREIFPLSTLGTSAVNSAIQLAILLGAILVTGSLPSVAQLAYLPFALIVLVVYATLFGLLLSALNVYMRDIQHLIEVITFLAFWASPIVYSYSYVQKALETNYPIAHEIYLSNPVTLAILGFQKSLWAAGVDQPYPLAPHDPPGPRGACWRRPDLRGAPCLRSPRRQLCSGAVMSMPEVVRVQDVSKVFKLHRDTSVKDRVLHSSRARVEEFHALDNVSVDVRLNESVGPPWGHNGSGKSTLLKIMGSIIRPTSGRVTTRGRMAALLELARVSTRT